MAEDLPDYGTDGIPPDSLSRHEVVALLVLTAESLDLIVVRVSDSGMVARTQAAGRKMQGQLVAAFGDNGLEAYCNWADGRNPHSGEDEALLRRFFEAYHDLKSTIPRETLQQRYRSMGALFTPDSEAPLPRPAGEGRASGLLGMFIPTAGYTVTPLLLIANILVFVLMLFNGASLMEPGSDVLVRWGANYTPATLGGEWWRLLTCVFIHIGVLHLLMNMYALVYIGAMLEPRIGSLRFGVAYLVTGIGASLVSLWWHPVVLSAGASGAVFGMYGVFLAMLTTNLIEAEARRSLLSSIGVFVLYNLLFGIQGGIDNAAHIGGLLTGIATGYAFYPSLRNPASRRLRNITPAIVLAVAAVLSVVAAGNIHNVMAVYQQNLERFSANESRFQAIMKNPGLTTDAAYGAAYREGIPLWIENVAIANDLAQLDLPAGMKARSGQLARYAALRLTELRLAETAVTGSDDQDSLQAATHKAVQAVLDSLNKE